MKQKHNKLTLFAVFFIMFFATMATVKSQPFVQEPDSTHGVLEVVTPKPLVFALDSNVTSGHFHVFNSTGHILTPIVEANCTIHIYDSLNHHALMQNLTADSNGIDFVVTLNQSYFSQIGDFGFITWCENGNEAGFFSGTFKVTRTGLDQDDHGGILAGILLTLGTTALLFWFGSLLDDKDEREWLQAIKLLVNIVALFILIIGSGIFVRSIYLFDYPTSIVNIAKIVYIVMLFTVIPILLIFLVMFIKQLMEFWEELRKGDDFG